jgi:cytosine/adenosine deaminase-related metal-dependent hydrolase
VFPVSGPPLRDGVLTARGERIVAVGPDGPAGAPVDLGDVALLPGLVNAHTHLEFSGLEAPLDRPGTALPDWIRAVVAWRRTTPRSPGAIERGLAQSLAAGTTLLGDILQPDQREALAAAAAPDVVGFLELLGLKPDRRRQLDSLAARHLSERSTDAQFVPGLSPHAPYSTHPGLVRAAVRLAGSAHPVAMHLAESRQELELLATGHGPFRDLLEELGAWSPEVFAAPRRIADYLEVLSAAGRSLVIHGNYLTDHEASLIARQAGRMSLVYCPRTHAYFGHEPYPLVRRLAAGVPVALGTDGRASNPDLSLLAEMRAVARLHSDLPPDRILELGTLAGARALGLEADHGSLAPGKLANAVVVPLPAGEWADPAAALLADTAGPIATLYRGQLEWGDRRD